MDDARQERLRQIQATLLADPSKLDETSAAIDAALERAGIDPASLTEAESERVVRAVLGLLAHGLPLTEAARTTAEGASTWRA